METYFCVQLLFGGVSADNNNSVYEFQKVKPGRVYGRRYSMPNFNFNPASSTVYSYTTRTH